MTSLAFLKVAFGNCSFFSRIVFLIPLICSFKFSIAQLPAYTFKKPIITIDFGQGEDQPDINAVSLPSYRQVYYSCPTDGHFSFATAISSCFHDHWITMNGDHTGNGGRMMLVNASYYGGVFFHTVLKGLKGNTTYELASWITNVCKLSNGCPPLPPNITMRLITPEGREIVAFHTGSIYQRDTAHWKRHVGFFTTPANVTSLILIMEDETPGGCGNDFALDDITVRERIPITPEIKIITKAAPKKTPATNPAIKKSPQKTTVPKRQPPVVTIEKPKGEVAAPTPIINEKLPVLPMPKVISSRENPVIKQLQTEAGELIINLYDNGEVDGDTVSVYHNNELIISKERLSAKPINFHIQVDAQHPHHELVMVANNLGTIPPNTSLMIIKINNKRYEVFISSTEQKNAKIVIDLK